MATLQIVNGTNAGEAYRLERRETLVGRHPDCTIVLRDSTVSRRHARILENNDGYYVDDVGSQHGTRVNGDIVRSPQKLKDRDEIVLSQTRLVFIDSDSGVEDNERPSTIITAMDVLGTSSDTQTGDTPKWRALLDITRSLGASLDLREILPKVLESTFLILPQASRGCILLAHEQTNRLIPFVVRDSRGGGADRPPAISRTITSSVMEEAQAVLSTDVTEDERFQGVDSVLNMKALSVLAAPLIGSADRPFGLIYLDAQDPSQQFTGDDLEILVNIGNLVGQAVDHAQLHETQLEFDRRERDLETARQVQQHFLPQERPTISGYELYDYYNPADAVGGDYFGYTALPDGQFAIKVGDVAGHGIPAALLMARLCAEARYALVTDIIISEAVESLNRELCKQTYSFFITFAMCVLDPRRHQLTVVNAGHMPPLLRRAESGEIERVGVDAVCPPLGIEPRITFAEATTKIQPGDVVLMYTDGVSEAHNPEGELFGIERVEAIVADSKSPKQAVDKLLQAVKAWAQGTPQGDDICVVAFGREAD